MATTITSAGSEINLRLGESPNIKDPALNYEMQLIYNSIRVLGTYLGALRANFEFAPGQDPSESVRFRRTFWATALQDITVGAVVSAYADGVVNGVSATQPVPVVNDGGVTIGSTGSRSLFGVTPVQFFIALTTASAGQPVQIGVGPGIIKLANAKCGQIVWGVAALSINTYRDANTSTQIVFPGTLVNNGGLYLANITGTYTFPSGGGYNWEGYWTPGFPYNSGGTYYYSRAFLYPIGICVSDGFVLFSDYKRSDPLPNSFL